MDSTERRGQGRVGRFKTGEFESFLWATEAGLGYQVSGSRWVYSGPECKSLKREVAGGMDLNGCSRGGTAPPLARASKLGQDSIF